jgi:hypothetical protein
MTDMTARERTMSLALGAAAVVFGSYWGFNKYQGAKAGLDTKIKNKLAELNEVGLKKQQCVKNVELWHNLGGQTLATNPTLAQTHLRDDLYKLAEECGLEHASGNIGKVVRLGRPASRDQKNFVQVLSASIHAEGHMDGIARFLYRLHARPYIVRVRSLTLTHPSRKDKSILGMQAELETPLLPPTKLVSHFNTAPIGIPESQEKPRTLWATFEDYKKTVVRRKLLQPSEDIVVKAINPSPGMGGPLPYTATLADLHWAVPPQLSKYVKEYKVYWSEGSPGSLKLVSEPTATQPAKVHRDGLKIASTYFWRVDTVHEDWEGNEITTRGDVWNFHVAEKPVTVVKNHEDGVKPPPPPPPPPADAEFTVARILSSPMGQYVILEDRRGNRPNPPEKKVELGEPLFDGKLVYLHPRGAVSVKGEGKDREWRIHPMGEQVGPGMKILPDLATGNLYGDVWQELTKLREKSNGITERPEASPVTGG